MPRAEEDINNDLEKVMREIQKLRSAREPDEKLIAKLREKQRQLIAEKNALHK